MAVPNRANSSSFSSSTSGKTTQKPKSEVQQPKNTTQVQQQSSSKQYLPPPTAIHIGPQTQDQDLGDFLSELKKMDDETILGSRSQVSRR